MEAVGVGGRSAVRISGLERGGDIITNEGLPLGDAVWQRDEP